MPATRLKVFTPLFFALTGLFLVSRLVNLTRLPIFTDEANYLDWGWRETSVPGSAFYSLYDAKPPLVLWLFGLGQKVTGDPLVAGRTASVLLGLVTLTGVYLWAKQLFGGRVALAAAGAYVVCPLLLFFDRQALLETAVGGAGVWTGYLLWRLTTAPSLALAIGAGLTIGGGFFAKPSFLLFIASAGIGLVFLSVSRRLPSRLVPPLVLTSVSALVVLLPLLLQPQFWQTWGTTSRYSLSLSQIIGPPWSVWSSNLWATADILWWQLTPAVLVLALVGLIKLRRQSWLVVWSVVPLVLQVVISQTVINRYLVSLVAPWTILAGYALVHLRPRLQIAIALLLTTTLGASLVQIVSPIAFLRGLSRLTRYSYVEPYLDTHDSGFSVNNAVAYFKDLAQNRPLIVGLALNSGNPEAGLLVYLRHQPQITVAYLDRQLLGPAIDDYDCLRFDRPTYLVARDQGAAGLAKFAQPEKVIGNPVNSTTIHIFSLRQNCPPSKTLRLNLQ